MATGEPWFCLFRRKSRLEPFRSVWTTLRTDLMQRVAPPPRWRGVRVFISSTFRDMHAERDVLVRAVFPELRRRAAAHRLHLQEVELRWGVTEEESGRAAELCLTEVCRSHLLVGVLGERYGTVAATPPHLPDLPQHRWVRGGGAPYGSLSHHLTLSLPHSH